VLLIALTAPARADPGADASAPLVDVGALAALRVELRYATPANFTGRVVYDVGSAPRCYLRRPVAVRLAAVQAELAQRRLGLKAYDCYRPLSVQRILWRLVPDERYVADPQKGSRHNRGAAVDVTLVDERGRELEMPTAFDDFSERAHRDYQGASPAAREHRALLEEVMTRHGFVPLPTEWWHFDDRGWESYPLTDVSFAALEAERRAHERLDRRRRPR
jgi:D-alanyl-D-alanine dipeptidase